MLRLRRPVATDPGKEKKEREYTRAWLMADGTCCTRFGLSGQQVSGKGITLTHRQVMSTAARARNRKLLHRRRTVPSRHPYGDCKYYFSPNRSFRSGNGDRWIYYSYFLPRKATRILVTFLRSLSSSHNSFHLFFL